MIILKQKDIKPLREKLHKEQNYICPICKEKIPLEQVTLDHQHKLFKDQLLSENGAGEVRGVLCFQCNSAEGMFFNKFKRQGLHKKDISYTDWLRNLADYLDQDNLEFIHPTEVPKKPDVSKSNYNKLKKAYLESNKKAKFPVYPKSKKLTKKLDELFCEFKINPYNS